MIQPNEMRIGNYITYCDEMFTTTGFRTDQYRPRVWLSDGRAKTINWIKPIPLTEEWLLKFGFKFRDKDRFSEVYYYKDECSFNDSGVQTIVLSRNFVEEQTSREVKFVHQLQNLYFALTGEELEVKQ